MRPPHAIALTLAVLPGCVDERVVAERAPINPTAVPLCGFQRMVLAADVDDATVDDMAATEDRAAVVWQGASATRHWAAVSDNGTYLVAPTMLGAAVTFGFPRVAPSGTGWALVFQNHVWVGNWDVRLGFLPGADGTLTNRNTINLDRVDDRDQFPAVTIFAGGLAVAWQSGQSLRLATLDAQNQPLTSGGTESALPHPYPVRILPADQHVDILVRRETARVELQRFDAMSRPTTRGFVFESPVADVQTLAGTAWFAGAMDDRLMILPVRGDGTLGPLPAGLRKTRPITSIKIAASGTGSGAWLAVGALSAGDVPGNLDIHLLDAEGRMRATWPLAATATSLAVATMGARLLVAYTEVQGGTLAVRLSSLCPQLAMP